VALWALGFFRASVRARTGGCGSGSSLTTMWNYYVKRQVQEDNKEITPEAMPNYISMTIQLFFSPSSKETIPRFCSVKADIIK
jgi:hypothetical protein